MIVKELAMREVILSTGGVFLFVLALSMGNVLLAIATASLAAWIVWELCMDSDEDDDNWGIW